jgi:hypothetical protein
MEKGDKENSADDWLWLCNLKNDGDEEYNDKTLLA